MEKLNYHEGIYKIINNTSKKIEYDFLCSNQNFEQELISFFTKNQLPLSTIDEVLPLMNYLFYQVKLNKKFYNKNDIDQIIDSSFNFVKNFQNESMITKVQTSPKNIFEKIIELEMMNKSEEIRNYEHEILLQIDNFYKIQSKNEQILRSKQEQEMQSANLNNLPLDAIVNQHISQLCSFSSEYKQKFIEMIIILSHNFAEKIEQIYNNCNEIIHLSDYCIINNEREEKVTKENSFQSIELFFINFSFQNLVQSSISITIYQVEDLLENDLPNLINKNQNKEGNSLFDEYKYSKGYGNKITAMLNYFSYNTNENKMTFLFDKFLSANALIKEVLFENINSIFNKIESTIISGKKLEEYDIICSKHWNPLLMDLLLNVYINSFSTFTENIINESIGNIIYFCNIHRISHLIIPLEIILDKAYKINKFSEFKIFIKSVKNLMSLIKNIYNTLSSLGM